MKNSGFISAFGVVALVGLASPAPAGSPVGTAFTYQGQLKVAGATGNGLADFRFTLFDAATDGNVVAGPLDFPDVEVLNGLFTVQVDFGTEAFNGDQRWLEISVDGTPLAPRQPITATPYALSVRAPVSLSSSSAPVVEAATDSMTFDSAAIRGTHSGAAGSPTGVQGEVTQSLLGSAGVTGLATAVTGNGWGMLAQSSSPEGTGLAASVGNTLYYRPGAGVVGAGPDTGVLGYTPTTTGRTYGVYARAVSPLGFGVYGEQGTLNGIPTPPAGVFGGSADGIGVFGLTDGVDEAGIYGLATSSAIGGIGVKGRSNAVDGYAGYFLGRSYFSTNVGIGTDSPFFKLDVAFSGRNGVRVVGDGNGDAFYSIQNGVAAAHYLFDNPTGGHALTLESGTGTDVVFNTDGRKERMRITADGNVGIGSSEPVYKLDMFVAGRNGMRIVGDGVGPAFYSIVNNGPEHYLFDDIAAEHAFTLESGFGADLVFNTSGANERMRITDFGNVGIGTASPAASLHAISNTSDAILGQSNAAGTFLAGVRGIGAGQDCVGVRGEIPHTPNGTTYGGYFYNDAINTGGLSVGVYGIATAESGRTMGVLGRALSPLGHAGYFDGRGYFSDNVGIGDTSPNASLTVGDGDKFQVAGAEGDVTFTDDLASINFPGSAGANAPMITMFASGVENANRMVLAHSPTFSNWGLQFQDTTGNAFHFLRSGTSVMTVDLENSGVGINTNNPSGFALAVNGMAAKPGGGSWSSLSDRRLKKDVEPLCGALTRLLTLRGVTFEFTEEGLQTGLASPGRHTGLIAQEVEEVFPEWVGQSQRGYKFVTEQGTTALTVEAIRELKAQHDAEIAALKERLLHLERLVDGSSPVGPKEEK